MAQLSDEKRVQLLRDLSDMGAGQAEGERDELFKKTFYPVPEHARAFDTNVVLIVGDRGSGKSELFQAVTAKGLFPAIARHAPGVRLPPLDSKRTRFLNAYPAAKEFPDARGLNNFFVGISSREAAHDLWFAYLMRTLQNEIDNHAKMSLKDLFNLQSGMVKENYLAFQAAGNEPVLALDRLDEELEKKDAWLFVGYDELDTLGGFHWDTMKKAISGLIDFWASYSRRWQRIRAKIFIRTDLYKRTEFFGAEIVKLAANRVELVWSDLNLYAMLVKRIVNQSEGLRDYCTASRITMKEPDDEIGLIPLLQKPVDAKPLIIRMCGQYMGAGIGKGQTFSWLLNHIRDGRGMAMPRVLVRLLEKAAVRELNNRRAEKNELLHHVSLRGALDDVSREHVNGVKSHEWPWIAGLEARLKNSSVMMARKDAERLIRSNWKDNWGEKKGDIIRPPEEDPREFVDYLLELGIFSERGERIDVPDLYLSGLGLKRKGGVRRK